VDHDPPPILPFPLLSPKREKRKEKHRTQLSRPKSGYYSNTLLDPLLIKFWVGGV